MTITCTSTLSLSIDSTSSTEGWLDCYCKSLMWWGKIVLESALVIGKFCAPSFVLSIYFVRI